MGRFILYPVLFFGLIIFSNVWAQSAAVNAFNLDDNIREYALAILRDGLHDEDYAPSLHAAEGLTLAGYADEIFPVFETKLMNERTDAQRAGIAREIARAGDLSKIELLSDILSKNDPSSRIAAAEGLYKLGEIGDLGAMKRAAQSREDVILHLMASGALARQGNKEALDAIKTTYLEGDIDAIRIGAWLIGRVGAPEDADLLQSRLSAVADETTEAFIYHAMAALGSEMGLAKLVENLSSVDPSIRAYAATFAGDADAVSLSEKLIDLLEDPVADVRYRAAQTLLGFDLASQK